MTYYNKVHVWWSEPIHLDESFDSEMCSGNGLYFITREYIRNGTLQEYPLYVGITTRCFYSRLSEHLSTNSKWIESYGRKTIRFGKISIYNLQRYELFRLLNDIESQIIQDVEEDYPGRLINRQQKNTYNYNYNLFIQHHNNIWLDKY